MLNWFHLNNDIMVYCVNKSNLASLFFVFSELVQHYDME